MLWFVFWWNLGWALGSGGVSSKWRGWFPSWPGFCCWVGLGWLDFIWIHTKELSQGLTAVLILFYGYDIDTAVETSDFELVLLVWLSFFFSLDKILLQLLVCVCRVADRIRDSLDWSVHWMAGSCSVVHSIGVLTSNFFFWPMIMLNNQMFCYIKACLPRPPAPLFPPFAPLLCCPWLTDWLTPSIHFFFFFLLLLPLKGPREGFRAADGEEKHGVPQRVHVQQMIVLI